MRIRIDQVDRRSLPQLVEIVRSTFIHAYILENDPVHFKSYLNKELSERKLEQELTGPDEDFYFLYVGVALAGYCKLHLRQQLNVLPGDGTHLYLSRLYVRRSYQGKGLGTKLLRFALQKGREARHDHMWLSVWKKRPRTIDLYRRNGLRIVGEEIYPVGEDPQEDYLMAIRL